MISKVGGLGGRTRREPPRCTICVMYAPHHKRMGRGRVIHLCNRHERKGREAGLRTRDDWEAYVIITRTFGEVDFRNAIQE